MKILFSKLYFYQRTDEQYSYWTEYVGEFGLSYITIVWGKIGFSRQVKCYVFNENDDCCFKTKMTQ